LEINQGYTTMYGQPIIKIVTCIVSVIAVPCSTVPIYYPVAKNFTVHCIIWLFNITVFWDVTQIVW